MKAFVIFLVASIGFITSQDVPITGDLLGKPVDNSTEPDGVDPTELDLQPPLDNLVDARDPNVVCSRLTQPNSPCCNFNQQANCRPQPPTFVLVQPTVNSTVDKMERDEILLCPIGSIQNGTECVATYSNECNHGYSWNGHRCVLSRTICAINFDWDGRSCVQRQICPTDHVWQNGRCVQPEPRCPPGLSWNGLQCEFDDTQCPSGSFLRGKECVIEDFTCPIGYQEIGGTCVKPPLQCQPGFELQPSGFCRQVTFRCPTGSVMENGECRRTTTGCPPGTYQVGNQCYPFPDPTPRPPPPQPPIDLIDQPIQPTCPAGFVLYNNLCYRCPSSYKMCNSQCVRKTANCNSQTTIPNININMYTRERPSRPSQGGGFNVVNKVEPVNNTIVNVNNITNPVTLNNVNENNIFIYTDTQCRDGSIKTVIVKNNETINGCVDVDADHTSGESTNINNRESREGDEPEKCCEIVTPRQCKKSDENKWICTHRRYKYCGKFCIADRLYLKPPATSYVNNILTIAPSQPPEPFSPCFGRSCPPIDCGGCINGSTNCSPQCYSYPCQHDGCSYLDQSDFCGAVGGQICE